MPIELKYIIRNRLTALTITCLVLVSCGGGNTPAGPAPNVGNIPQLSQQPQNQTKPEKKLKFSGRVFNALNHDAIERATIWIHVLEEASPPQPASAGTPQPQQPTATPTIMHSPPATGASPQPTGSPSPNSGVTPSPTITPPGSPSPTPATETPSPVLDPSNLSRLLPLPKAIGAGHGTDRFQLAQKPPEKNEKSAGIKSYRTTSNNQGKFWIDDVPEGTHAITIYAPQYRMLTIVNTNPARLDIPLTPLNTDQETTDIAGMVLSPSEKPIGSATVSPSFIVSESIGIPTTSNGIGEFAIPAVSYGTHTFAAFIMDTENVIRQMGLEKGIKITPRNVKATEKVLDKIDKLPKTEQVSPKNAPKIKALSDEVEDILRATPAPETTQPEPSPESSMNPIKEIEAPSPFPSATSEELLPEIPKLPRPSIEEEEETATDKEDKKNGFNLFKSLGGLITGKDMDDLAERPVFPVITIRSVLSDQVLEGKVAVPEGFKLNNMDVYLTLEPEQQFWTEEIYLFSQALKPVAPTDTKDDKTSEAKEKEPKKSGAYSQPFRVRLPQLEKSQYYHLQFTATSTKKGHNAVIYKHAYGLDNKQASIDLQIMLPPEKLEVSGAKDHAVPLAPHFQWEPVTGTDIYRVLLEAGTGENTKIVWEAWTPATEITYPLTTIPGRLQQGESYRVSVSAVKGLKSPAKTPNKEAYAHPGFLATWTDLTQIYADSFEVIKLD